MIEVLELDRLQRALPEPVVEQEPQRDPVAEEVGAGDDRAALIVRERRPVHGPGAGPLDRERRIAMQRAAKDLKLEEILHDRQVLVVVPRAPVPVLRVEELLKPARADRRLW